MLITLKDIQPNMQNASDSLNALTKFWVLQFQPRGMKRSIHSASSCQGLGFEESDHGHTSGNQRQKI